MLQDFALESIEFNFIHIINTFSEGGINKNIDLLTKSISWNTLMLFNCSITLTRTSK